MGWLDPKECTAAKDHLAKGHPIEAARILLESKYRHHRAVRNLLMDVQKTLLEEARRHWQASEIDAAAELVAWAKKCGDPPPESVPFCQQVEEAYQTEQKRRAWAAAQLSEARKLAEAGHVHTALDLLAVLPPGPEKDALEIQCQQRRAQFERAIEACRQMLDRGEVVVARRFWEKARKINPHHPDIVDLARRIALVEGTARAGGPLMTTVPIRERFQRFLLRRVAIVIPLAEVAIGSPQEKTAHLRLLGPVHSRHAVLIRDRHGWHLAPLADRHGKPCYLRVNGNPVSQAVRLSGGEEIAFAPFACSFLFSVPVANSLTAVLEPLPGASASIWAEEPSSVPRAILMADELIIRPQPPAHIVLPDLPCAELRFFWEKEGLRWQSCEGDGYLELPGVGPVNDEPYLRVPCRLVLESTVPEAERLGRQLAGGGPASSWEVDIVACPD